MKHHKTTAILPLLLLACSPPNTKFVQYSSHGYDADYNESGATASLYLLKTDARPQSIFGYGNKQHVTQNGIVVNEYGKAHSICYWGAPQKNRRECTSSEQETAEVQLQKALSDLPK